MKDRKSRYEWNGACEDQIYIVHAERQAFKTLTSAESQRPVVRVHPKFGIWRCQKWMLQ